MGVIWIIVTFLFDVDDNEKPLQCSTFNAQIKVTYIPFSIDYWLLTNQYRLGKNFSTQAAKKLKERTQRNPVPLCSFALSYLRKYGYT